MTLFIGTIIVVLVCIIFLQIGRISDLSRSLRGEEAQISDNEFHARLSFIFMILFLAGSIISAWYYKNYMLGFGPHDAASAHGDSLDYMFRLTLFFTGIVFVVTHIVLYWFTFKYRERKGTRASFVSHNNRLEIIWTIIPAVVMTFLVVGGLDAWNEVMADIGPEEEHIEIEAIGMQYAWLLRHPGSDGLLGARDFRLTSGLNPMAQDWSDVKNHDDIHIDKIVLPVNKKVRVRINSRDVLHNFYLPHFRLKMDAVPGMPTYFVFTPSVTTEQYRQKLSEYAEYQIPADPSNPDGPQLWEVFNFELACAELCGQGHYAMRRIVEVVEENEYRSWLATQTPYYVTSIKGTDADPFRDQDRNESDIDSTPEPDGDDEEDADEESLLGMESESLNDGAENLREI